MIKIDQDFINEWEHYNFEQLTHWEIDNEDNGIKRLTYFYENGLITIIDFLN